MSASSTRFALALGAAIIWLAVVATPASADHCGAEAEVAPNTGSVGAVFRIHPNLGAEARLTIYHDGRRVRAVTLPGDQNTYLLHTTAGDTGEWRAASVVVGQPECRSSVSFEVIGAPETDVLTAAADRGGAVLLPTQVGLLAAMIIGMAAFLRRINLT